MSTVWVRPCPYCNSPVLHDFGLLDAEPYHNGVVQRHYCVGIPAPPLNDRQWAELAARFNGPQPRGQIPPPPIPAPQKRKRDIRGLPL